MSKTEMFFTFPQETWDKRLARKKQSMFIRMLTGASYNGEIRPLPVLAEGYEIIVVPTWGWRIRKV